MFVLINNKDNVLTMDKKFKTKEPKQAAAFLK